MGQCSQRQKPHFSTDLPKNAKNNLESHRNNKNRRTIDSHNRDAFKHSLFTDDDLDYFASKKKIVTDKKDSKRECKHINIKNTKKKGKKASDHIFEKDQDLKRTELTEECFPKNIFPTLNSLAAKNDTSSTTAIELTSAPSFKNGVCSTIMLTRRGLPEETRVIKETERAALKQNSSQETRVAPLDGAEMRKRAFERSFQNKTPEELNKLVMEAETLLVRLKEILGRLQNSELGKINLEQYFGVVL